MKKTIIIALALMFPMSAMASTSCQTLLDRVTAGYNQVCGDAVADVNKDGKTDSTDLAQVIANNDTWCEERLLDTSDPCYVAPAPVAPTVYVPANVGGGGCGPECRWDWTHGGSFRAEIQAILTSIQNQINEIISQLK